MTMMTTVTKRRVHVYSRAFGEWVVFESGSFDDHVVFTDFDQAVRHGRELAEACEGRLQAHGRDGTLLDCSDSANHGAPETPATGTPATGDPPARRDQRRTA
jgi:hypothetical protein